MDQDDEFKERGYQTEGIAFMGNTHHSILAMDMGLGKSYVAIRNGIAKGAQRVLINAGVNAQLTWVTEQIPEFWPEMAEYIVRVEGPVSARQELWNKIDRMNRVVAISTYQGLHACKDLLQDLSWDYVINDEAQKGLNRKTKIHEGMKVVGHRADEVTNLSGALLRRGAQDFWALLHAMDRKKFPSYWDFVSRYVHIIDGPFGMQLGGPKNLSELRELLKPYIFHKSKKDPDVASTMPPKSRYPLYVEMDKEQRALYDKLTNDMIVEHGETLLVAPNRMAVFLRHQQLLVCPKILFPECKSMGAGFEAIAERMEEEPHVVIYTPYIDAIPIIKAELHRRKYKTVVSFQGGMKLEELQRAKEEFAQHRGVAIMSIKYAESINLPTSSYGYFLGPDMDQNLNYQAEDRIHRANSPLPVSIYYAWYLNSIHEHIFGRVLGWKQKHVRETWEGLTLKNLAVGS